MKEYGTSFNVLSVQFFFIKCSRTNDFKILQGFKSKKLIYTKTTGLGICIWGSYIKRENQTRDTSCGFGVMFYTTVQFWKKSIKFKNALVFSHCFFLNNMVLNFICIAISKYAPVIYIYLQN